MMDNDRGMRKVNFQNRIRLTVGAAALGCAAAVAQYPGQIKEADKDVQTLRAVAVLEWTGDADHPKAIRLVPVCVYDGQELQDAGVYLSRPAPMALESEVEYQLLENGHPVGLFDVEGAGREQSGWVGYGKRKAMPVARTKPARMVKIDEDEIESDVPVLHRKHHASEAGGGNSSDSNEPTLHRSGDAADSDSGAPTADPDRPTLHKSKDADKASAQNSDSGEPTLHRTGDAKSGDSGNSPTASSTTPSSSSTLASDADSNAPAPDPDRPTLHKRSDESAAKDSGSSKPKKKKNEDVAFVDSVDTVADPDRPQLKRGNSGNFGGAVLPSLIGLPADMRQQVAVSDIKDRPVHPRRR